MVAFDYTAAPNYWYMVSNDAGHNQVFIIENDGPGIDPVVRPHVNLPRKRSR